MPLVYVILGCILGTLLIGGLGPLCLYGLVSPFVAASVTTVICYLLQLPVEGSLVVVVGAYLSCTLLQITFAKQDLSNSVTVIAQHEPCESQSDYDKRDGARNAVITLFGIVAMWILPIPKPPVFSGPVIFLLAAVLTAYSCYKDAKQPIGRTLMVVGIQSIALLFVFTLMGDSVQNPILGLITCISLPSILLAEKKYNAPRRSTSPVRAGFLTLCLFMSLATPGYSISCIAAALFPKDTQRTTYLCFLNGCMEGWVLNRLSRGDLSGKTPLGDVLGSRPFLLGDSEVSPLFTLTLLVTLALSVAVSYCIWKAAVAGKLPTPPRLKYRYIVAMSLAIQASFTVGMWTIPLLGVGFAIYFLRTIVVPEDDDTLALAFLVPISFA